MRSRLEDLIATADRQLTARSYDAAIDTLRTALAEAGAVEAGVEERMEAVLRARDEARGIVRAAPPPPAPVVEMAEAAPIVEAQAEPQSEPEPTRPPVVPFRTIEPPRFASVQDDPARLERFDREQYPMLEVERLSILHPTAAPDPEPEPDTHDRSWMLKRMVLAAVIAVAVCLIAICIK